MKDEEAHYKPAPTVRYDSSKTTPLAATVDLDHAQIEEVAQRYRIPLYEDSGVVEALARLDISATIPAELYGVIAEVLAHIYRLDNA